MNIVNVNHTELEPMGSDTPTRFAVASASPSQALGSERTGAFITELQPGQSHAPYHYEVGLEKWLLVLGGDAVVRTPNGISEITAGDLCFLPPGPAGALEVRNTGEAPVRLLFFSEVSYPCVTVYPDSGKVGVWMGGDEENLIVERGSGVGYFHGEA